MAEKLDPCNYIDVQGWMVTKHGLQGEELLAYAIIYGFSQDGAGWYFGGREYLCKWLGCGEKKAGRILNDLVEKGIVRRDENKGYAGRGYKYQVIRAKSAPITGQADRETGQTGPNIRAKSAPYKDKYNYKGIKENAGDEKSSSKPTDHATSHDAKLCPKCGQSHLFRNRQMARWECGNCFYTET